MQLTVARDEGARKAESKPRLKGVVWERDGDELRLAYDVRDYLVLPDPTGAVAVLLELLAEGGRTIAELARVLAARGISIPVDEISAAVAVLDGERLLEDGSRLPLPDADRERYFSNLAYFESFASLSQSREDIHRVLRSSHVLVLGTGGLNSNTIPHLCGLGIGRLTLLDRDEVELRNFARQYLYRYGDVGARKVVRAAEWVRRFDPAIEVATLDTGVDSAEHLERLLDRHMPDIVMSGIDSPLEIDDWVNDSCASRRIPYVRGGMWVTQGVVWSVDPGVSACRSCGYAEPATTGPTPDDAGRMLNLLAGRPRVNRGIGPVAGLLGALCAFEVLRYLTRIEQPAYAARPLLIDFADCCATRQDAPWVRSPRCRACADVKEGGDTRYED